jgi:diguanylate cyclase (GGDEF)-like protein
VPADNKQRQDANQDLVQPDDGLDALRAENARLKDQLLRAEWKIAELEANADSDPLLDIPNRRGFERELRRSIAFVKRYGTPAALIFIDLDGFKAINDQHGHGAGDTLLRAVATVLTQNVRASDAVGRLGGDEFGLLLWNIDEARAVTKAADLESLIARTRIDYGPVWLSVGASAGTAVLRGDATVEQLLEAADKTMYARKNERRAT